MGELSLRKHKEQIDSVEVFPEEEIFVRLWILRRGRWIRKNGCPEVITVTESVMCCIQLNNNFSDKKIFKINLMNRIDEYEIVFT